MAGNNSQSMNIDNIKSEGLGGGGEGRCDLDCQIYSTRRKIKPGIREDREQ